MARAWGDTARGARAGAGAGIGGSKQVFFHAVLNRGEKGIQSDSSTVSTQGQLCLGVYFKILKRR
jgi:hypothetical protein